MRYLAPAMLMLLAACGTPQEQCIASSTRDLRIVDRLIVETEGNLQRGYALEDVTIYTPEWVNCPVVVQAPPVDDAPAVPPPTPRLCLDERAETITRPKAIDLNAEAQKLQSLQQKRGQLAKAAAAPIAACRASYPE